MSGPALTAKRLFSDPSLQLAAPHSFAFSPDGSLLTYLQVSSDDRERMDLWCYDFADSRQRCLLDARSIAVVTSDVASMTSAERAERERRRQFAFGITQYAWHPKRMLLLVPVDGQAYIVDVSGGEPEWRCLTPNGTRQVGFTFSTLGDHVSYVRDGDLYCVDVAGASERRLTHDAGPSLTNGLPDFLAAEEMHRFAGHWWTSDDRAIAYCKVDDSGVDVSYRMEIDADGTRTVEQRYPYAGGPVPQVALHHLELETGEDRAMWQTSAQAPYLARVHSTASGLVIQTQDRLQQSLTVQRFEDDEWRVIYRDQSPTWVNLTDDLRVVDEAVIFTTEDRGGRRAVRWLDGTLHELAGPAHINKVLHANNEALLASGWSESPLENHLFRIHLDGSGHEQLTQQPGWHDVTVDQHGARYVDRLTSDDLPMRISLGQLAAAGPQTELFAEEIDADHPYAPFLDGHAHAEFGSVAAEDGQPMYYRLTPPRRISGRHPVIVYVYGGPGAQKVRREWGSLLLQLFAEHGFGVLELDNRGTANRGSQFEAPLFRAMGRPEVRDQVKGLEALADVEWADVDRVGVFGHSYGGFMTLMCLTQATEHFKAGVAVAPVCDWRLYDTHYTERYMGLPDADADAYDAGNVLTYLDGLERPLLLMHGMADDNVLFTHSTMLMSALQRLGKPFELMTYPGAKHSMQEKHVSVHRFEMILDFFVRRL